MDPAGVCVRHVMTERVVFVRPEDSLATARTLLRQEVISGLPVLDGHGKLVGVVSERDIDRVLRGDGERPARGVALPRAHRRSSRPPASKGSTTRRAEDQDWTYLTSVRVRDVMSPDPIFIGPDASLDSAREIMAEHGIRRLPVLERGQLVGILSAHDLQASLPLADRARLSASPVPPV